jgi:hypothetical protein
LSASKDRDPNSVWDAEFANTGYCDPRSPHLTKTDSTGAAALHEMGGECEFLGYLPRQSNRLVEPAGVIGRAARQWLAGSIAKVI